jgi:hypothetical protein
MKKEFKDYILEQKACCAKFNVEWIEADFDLIIGISDNVFSDVIPINGLRHPIEKGTTGWYVWSGEKFNYEDNFFKPYCVKHLIDKKPEILKYLGLPPGYRFLIDNKNYEDIWEDINLLKL